MDQSKQPASPAAPQQSNQTQPAAQKTDVLGIISLVCAFIGLQVIGFILGLVGVKKAKEEGRPTTLSKIGWILNLIFMIIAAIIIIAIIALGAAASKEGTELNDAAKKLESSLEESESANSANKADLVAAYEKVNEGMSKADAEKELGSSSNCTSSSYSGLGSFESCSYGSFSDKVTISITYKDGAVQSKSKSEY
jgi:heme/copper-type cytochrome/quinol oxidase subunit 2